MKVFLYVLLISIMTNYVKGNFLARILPFWFNNEDVYDADKDINSFIEDDLISSLEQRMVHNLASFSKLVEDRSVEMADLII